MPERPSMAMRRHRRIDVWQERDDWVVDELFREARLVLGTGSDARVVTIHTGHKPAWWQAGGGTLRSGDGSPVCAFMDCGGRGR